MQAKKMESTALKYVDFRKFTDEHGAQSIYLFEGEEMYFSSVPTIKLWKRLTSATSLDVKWVLPFLPY